jgi:hypothetical protein
VTLKKQGYGHHNTAISGDFSGWITLAPPRGQATPPPKSRVLYFINYLVLNPVRFTTRFNLLVVEFSSSKNLVDTYIYILNKTFILY